MIYYRPVQYAKTAGKFGNLRCALNHIEVTTTSSLAGVLNVKTSVA
jgi:hypothetical protein